MFALAHRLVPSQASLLLQICIRRRVSVNDLDVFNKSSEVCVLYLNGKDQYLNISA